MITAIEIENFKCFGQRQRLELAPITLLFGSNSSGKSSVLHALLYLDEVLRRQNIDAGETAKGGAAVDLGGFRSVVQNRDLRQPIQIAVEFLVDWFPPSQAWDSGGLAFEDPFELDRVNTEKTVKCASVALTLAWSEILQQPFVARYEVKLNESPIGVITSSPDGKQVGISDLNLGHQLLQTSPDWRGTKDVGLLLAFDKELLRARGCREILQVLGGLPTDSDAGSEGGWAPIAGLESALPNLSTPDSLPDFPGCDDVEAYDWEDVVFSHQVQGVFSQLFVNPGLVLRAILQRMRYLGPLRQVPPRNFVPPRHPDESRWATGLGAWDALWNGGGELIASVSGWLSQSGRLAAGYQLAKSRYRRLDESSPLMLMLASGSLLDAGDIMKMIGDLPRETRLALIEDRTLLELLPHDVGTGVSQLLPVVVAALAPDAGLVCVEQPELHIHPGLQVRLGDLLASRIRGEDPKRFLIETHSEHLLLRLLRRIRETAAGELPRGVPPLLPEDVSVLYFEPSSDGTEVRKLEVTKNGDFAGDWPKGFFEERNEELF